MFVLERNTIWNDFVAISLSVGKNEHLDVFINTVLAPSCPVCWATQVLTVLLVSAELKAVKTLFAVLVLVNSAMVNVHEAVGLK